MIGLSKSALVTLGVLHRRGTGPSGASRAWLTDGPETLPSEPLQTLSLSLSRPLALSLSPSVELGPTAEVEFCSENTHTYTHRDTDTHTHTHSQTHGRSGHESSLVTKAVRLRIRNQTAFVTRGLPGRLVTPITGGNLKRSLVTRSFYESNLIVGAGWLRKPGSNEAYCVRVCASFNSKTGQTK